jgi:hypothetical protein
MKQTKTFEDQRLNDILFQLTERELVIPEGIKRVIPVLYHVEFILSAPYNINFMGQHVLANLSEGFGLRAGFRFFETMSEDVVRDLAGNYLEGRVLGLVGHTLAKINTAVCDKPLPFIDGLRRNAFEVSGYYVRA